MQSKKSLGMLRMLIAGFAISTTASFALDGLTIASTGSVDRQAVIAAYAKRPLSFERNDGQTDPRVKFLSRGLGYTLFLTGNQAVLSLQEEAAAENPNGAINPAQPDMPRPRKTESLQMGFVGANPNPKVVGLEQLPGNSNYLIGNDKTKWHTNVPTFAKVKYQDVYPGVDLVYYGNQRQLEYDFVVAAGADPTRIRLSFAGAKMLRVDSQTGDLLITTVSGAQMRHVRPRVYQQVGDRQVEVAGAYHILDGNQAAFTLAGYDRRASLVIDPTVFTQYLGGSAGSTWPSGIAIDASGNVYVTGLTESSDFPIVGGMSTPPKNNYPQTAYVKTAYVTKLSPTGQILFSTFLGGSGEDVPSGIAVDSSGIYVTGGTTSRDFSTYSTYAYGSTNAFVAKLSLDGSALAYCVTIGGVVRSNSSVNEQTGNAIALDSAHAAYVAGETDSVDFPTSQYFSTLQPMQKALRGYYNAFVVKVDPSGFLAYSTYLGGSGVDSAFGIAVDSTGHAYVTGDTSSTNFPTGGAVNLGSPGGSGFTAFVTKLSRDGSHALYSIYLGGRQTLNTRPMDGGTAIAVDLSGNAYIAGSTCSQNFPVSADAFLKHEPCSWLLHGTPIGGYQSGFATKLSATGGLLYSTYLEGNDGQTTPTSIGIDPAGEIYVAGWTSSTTFPGTPPLAANPSGLGFLTKFAPHLNAIDYSTLKPYSIQGVAVYQSRPAWFVQTVVTKIYMAGSGLNPNTGVSDTVVERMDECSGITACPVGPPVLVP